MVGRAHDDGIQVSLFFEQFAEIAVSRATAVLAGALLRTVIAIHDLLTRLASGHAGGGLHRMSQLNRLARAEPFPASFRAEQPAHGVAELVVAPLRIIRAARVGIAHGDP